MCDLIFVSCRFARPINFIWLSHDVFPVSSTRLCFPLETDVIDLLNVLKIRNFLLTIVDPMCRTFICIMSSFFSVYGCLNF